MKRILLAHPYKHHSYYSLRGIYNANPGVRAIYGYYYKNDVIDKIINHSSFKAKALGYKDEELNDRMIITNPLLKCKFLRSKLNEKRAVDYMLSFDNYTKKIVDRYDVLHVLHNYCNGAIREAKRNGLKVVYDQITVFDITLKKILEEEAELSGYPKSVIETRITTESINVQLENINIADVIICASYASYDSLRKNTDKPIYMFPYGIDIPNKIVPISRQFKSNEPFKLLYVGSMSLIKGVRYIIKAAEILREENIKFTFIGKPSCEEDKKYIKMIESLPNCTYIESIPHIEIDAFYQQNDAFVFQGLCEGFGMVSLEAVSNGLPCLVSKGACGIIEDGINGYINENRDVGQLINNINAMRSDENRYNRMRQAAFKAAQDCSWKTYSERISNLYKIENLV